MKEIFPIFQYNRNILEACTRRVYIQGIYQISEFLHRDNRRRETIFIKQPAVQSALCSRILIKNYFVKLRTTRHCLPSD